MAAYFTSARSSPLARWWNAQPTPVQRGWRWTAIAVVCLVAVTTVAQPLIRSADATRVALARDAIALADARERSAEIASRARSAAPVTADAKSELERVLAQTDVRAALTQLDWQDGRARLTFAAVGFEALVRALEALQREARLRVIDAKLTARVEPGTVRAELTLAR
jgi:type II secretory pathway component PulM